MCGRFSFSPNKKIIEEFYGIDTSDYYPQYNCAPSQTLAVITNNEDDKISFFKWGFIPHWACDLKKIKPMINAKLETISEKPFFKHSFFNNRCLVPADSFFEWQNIHNIKIPYRIFLKDREIFSMAGIWSCCNDKENDKLIYSFAIITTDANEFMKPLHNRMPAIIEKKDEEKWLFATDTKELLNICKPYDSDLMDCYKLSSKINNPLNNTFEILAPVL